MQHKQTAQAKIAALPAMVKYIALSSCYIATGGIAYYLSMM